MKIKPGEIMASAGPQYADETKHFYVCAQCGQAVDCRNLGAVLHHEDDGHEPLPVS